ncbi:MAG: caspase family protein [Verrucomicrobiota bacterium]
MTTEPKNAGQLLGVFCGVVDYVDSEWEPLPFCGRDATRLAETFDQLFPSKHKRLRVLSSDKKEKHELPSRANLLGALAEMRTHARPEDTVIFGFFGHGFSVDGIRYLLLNDSVTCAAADTAISLDDLKTRLDQIPAQRKVLLLDSCHSGRSESLRTRGRGDQPLPKSVEAFLRRLHKSEGWVVMAACRESELAHDHEKFQHGVFTHYLIEGLSGAADVRRRGIVSVNDLQEYVSEKVISWAQSNKVRQTPLIETMVTNDFPLAIVADNLPDDDKLVSIAIMGVKGGVGKGTVVNCAAQLIAEAGHDVAILDFDLETAGSTRDVMGRFPVKTLFDHLAARSAGFKKLHVPSSNEALWDITPDHCGPPRTGSIFLLPACNPERDLQQWEVVANLPSPRDETLSEIISQLFIRLKKSAPRTKVVLIDCGAGRNPIYSAAFASSTCGIIICLPDSTLFSGVNKILAEHSRRHPDGKFGPVFTVINRVTSNEDRERCSALQPSAFFPRDPLMEEDRFAHGKIDYDLGYNDFTQEVHKFLASQVLKDRKDLLPDEITVRVWPWYSRFVQEGLARKLLRSRQVLGGLIGFGFAAVAGLVTLPFALLSVWSPPSGPLSTTPVLGWTIAAMGGIAAWLLHQWPLRAWWLFRISRSVQLDATTQRNNLAKLLEKSNRKFLKWFREQLTDANRNQWANRVLQRSLKQVDDELL